MLSALIFDFDGLLLDTETPEVEGWRETFAAYGVDFPEEYFLWAVGRGAEQITERPIDFFKRALPNADHAQIAQEAHHRRLSAIYAQEPRSGTKLLLEAAADAGIRMAVASSSRHDWVDSHLERLGLAPYFELTVCAYDVARAKPFPDLYEAAIRRIGVPAANAVALEDSLNGATAADAAGLAVIHVPNPLTRIQQVPFAMARYDEFDEFDLGDIQALLIRQNEQNRHASG